MPNNENQKSLLEQLQRYVKIVSQDKPTTYRAKDVATLITALKDGHCSGITALWLYHKHRHKEKYFYDSIMNPILEWDGRKETLSKELENILEYTLSSVVTLHAASMFQKTQSGISMFSGIVQEKVNIQQEDYHLLINLIKQDNYPNLKKEDAIAFVFTNNELQDLLKSIPPNKLISLGSTDHAIGLFFDGQEYVLFDPNGFKGFFEKKFSANDVKNLVQNIQSAFFIPLDSNLTGLMITVFDNTDNPRPHYFERAKRIQKILDARIKNKETIHINQGSSYDNASPLYFAIRGGHSDVVKLLLSRGANIQVTKRPLMHQFAMGKFDFINELLTSPEGKAITDASFYGVTPLVFAILIGDTKIVDLLLQYGADIDLKTRLLANLLVKQMKCDLCLMSDLQDNDPKNAKFGKLYLSHDGSYVVCDPRNMVHQGTLTQESGIDMDNFTSKLHDPAFKKSVLEITSKRGGQTWLSSYIEIAQLVDSQHKMLQKAKHEIPKNWIDKDYANLVQIRTAYLSVDSRIKGLLYEVMELSEYCTGLRDPRALPVIQSKMERLNKIEQEVENLRTSIHLKTDHIPVNNPTRRNEMVIKSDKIFSELLNDINDARVNAQNAEKEIQSAVMPAVSLHLPPKLQ